MPQQAPLPPGINPRLEEIYRRHEAVVNSDPEIQAAIRNKATVDIQRGDTRYRITNGRVNASKGSLVIPILAAAGVAGGGMAAGALAGGGGAASTTAATSPLKAGPLVGGLTNTVPGAGMAPGVGGSSLGGFLSGLGGGIGGLDPKQLGAIGLIAAQLFKGRGGSGGFSGEQSGALNDLMGLQASQARRQDPLHQAVTQLATNLLPNSAFGAGPNRPLIR